jgi:hypothetical protein
MRGDDAGSPLVFKLIGSKQISSSTTAANAARGGVSAKSATALASTSRTINGGPFLCLHPAAAMLLAPALNLVPAT